MRPPPVKLMEREKAEEMTRMAQYIPPQAYWTMVNEVITHAAMRGESTIQINVPNIRTLEVFHSARYSTAHQPGAFPKEVTISW